MTKQQKEHAKKIIKKHYQLSHFPSDNEIKTEIENLKRKKQKGVLCDIALSLYSQLVTGQHAIDI